MASLTDEYNRLLAENKRMRLEIATLKLALAQLQKTATPEWLSQALNEGDGVYRA